MSAYFEPVTGRYLQLDLLGKPHRVYVEEAGAGIPLLCLHTAGADTRQYRGILNAPDILKNYRVIAFDLPWHGKSSPPAGWHNAEYRLTSRDYLDVIMAIVDALQLDKPVAPVVIGCSIGGRIALHLALEYPERFRAIIGLQAGAHVEPYYDLNWLHRPDVHGGEMAAGIVSGLMGPRSPEAQRWETLWHYMQGGPSVFMGDLHYYFTDGDLRNGLLDALDTKRCPLYLLTGEYDLSATPELTAALAKQAKATHFEVMKGMGHFPMSENPQAFRKYLLPVLARIAQT